MATWVIIAALATIGATALLTGVLYRVNAPGRRDGASDAGVVMADAGTSDRTRDGAEAADSSSGGDGGGGGGK